MCSFQYALWCFASMLACIERLYTLFPPALCTEDDTRTDSSTALIRKVLKQYEKEGKVEESQRLRKLFELARAAEQV